MNFDQFLEKYPLYPFQAHLCYKIYKDISLKREVTGLELIDGETIQLQNSYYLRGKISNSDSDRLYIPIHVDSEVDLEWYYDYRLIFTHNNWSYRLGTLAQKCENDNNELYACIGNVETVIYELVQATIP